MRVHLFTTDVSGLALLDALPAETTITTVIVPENRRGAAKLDALTRETARRGLSLAEHARGARLPEGLAAADAGISWLYSQVIRAEDLPRYPRGLLNMHGGRIPDYRGAHVLQWQIINGESVLGVTWHEIVAEVDAGAIRAESTIPIPPEADAATMREAMIAEGIRLFPNAWRDAVAGAKPVRIPDLSTGRVWPQRRPKDGRIAPGMSGQQVRDLVRALCPPWPPATIELDGTDYPVPRIADGPGTGRVDYTTEDGETLFLELGPRDTK